MNVVYNENDCLTTNIGTFGVNYLEDAINSLIILSYFVFLLAIHYIDANSIHIIFSIYCSLEKLCSTVSSLFPELDHLIKVCLCPSRQTRTFKE